ncbi:hypothetical protein DFH09DRAFT_1083273 [Mycena vulgaris]|nr:hypothetical protein DFH09DRAFT_1083273 [Mycena vulgaris]
MHPDPREGVLSKFSIRAHIGSAFSRKTSENGPKSVGDVRGMSTQAFREAEVWIQFSLEVEWINSSAGLSESRQDEKLWEARRITHEEIVRCIKRVNNTRRTKMLKKMRGRGRLVPVLVVAVCAPGRWKFRGAVVFWALEIFAGRDKGGKDIESEVLNVGLKLGPAGPPGWDEMKMAEAAKPDRSCG